MCVWMGGTGEGGGGSGYKWEFLVGCAAQFSKSWPCLRPKKKIISHPFQTWPSSNEIMPSIVRLEQQQKRFLKIHDYELLFIWNCTLPVFLENNLIPDLNGQSLYPFSDQNSAKPLPWGSTYLYVAYIREYPSGGSNGMLTEKVGERFNLTDQWWWRVTYMTSYNIGWEIFHFYWYNACCFTSTVVLHS